MPNFILKKISFLACLVACLAFLVLPVRAEVVYNRGNMGDPSTLDSHKTSTTSEAHIMRDLYEGLLQHNAKGESVPGAAESWTVSADGIVYTFKLRADGKWSNGEPVTAQDFVYSWRRALTPATGSRTATNLYPVKNAEDVHLGKKKPDELGVRAVDDKTLEVTLRSPTPYFTELLTHQVTFPLYGPSIEKNGADWVKPGNLISNGAYTVTENIVRDRLTLVKNKFYRNYDKIKIDVVKYIPIEDRAAALKRFEAGEIQSYEDLPVEQMDYIKSHLKDEARIFPYLGVYYYAIKTDKKPYDNAKLRRALSLAVDRDYLAQKIWNGTMFPAYSLTPPGVQGYTPAEADYKNVSQLEREDEARKIMEELGYNNGNRLKLEIRYNTGENHKNTAVAIADMYKNIYVDTTMVNVDGSTHYSYLQEKGDFDLARAGWIADYKDPQTFVAIGQTGSASNYSNFSDPEVDGWLRKAEAEIDSAKRMEYLHKGEEVILAKTPLIPLMFYTSKYLVSKRLKGFEENIISVHPSQTMSLDAGS